MDSAPAMMPAEILLVEDNEHYVYLTQRAFGKAKLIANLHHVMDFDKYVDTIRKFADYWLSVVMLPTRDPGRT